MANRIITADIQQLFENINSSNLNASVASGVGSITIYSIVSFAINQVLIIGEPGSAGSELIKTHTATAPTGNTVTLASNLTKSHAKDTPVYIISYDQIETSHADTETGAKSILSTATINPELVENFYQDTTSTAGYYFTRFKNSITTAYSSYSDPIPYGGLPDNTVGYAIDVAMNELGAKFTERLTFDMLIQFSKQMLRLVRGKLRSWNNYISSDEIFGTLSQGVRRYALPTEVYDQNSNRSIKNLRVGNNIPLTPITKDEYLQYTENVSYTEVATQAEISATSLVLDDTSDLDDDGSLNVYVSGTKYSIEYTANDRDTNTLTVDSDQITAVLPVDSQVWQGLGTSDEDDELEDEPSYFCVQDGYVYLWPMISSDFEGMNLTGDYLTDIETIDSQADILTGLKFDMLVPYLKWKIRAINENRAKEEMNDPSLVQFRELMNDAIKMEPLPEGTGFRPRSKAIFSGKNFNNQR